MSSWRGLIRIRRIRIFMLIRLCKSYLHFHSILEQRIDVEYDETEPLFMGGSLGVIESRREWTDVQFQASK